MAHRPKSAKLKEVLELNISPWLERQTKHGRTTNVPTQQGSCHLKSQGPNRTQSSYNANDSCAQIRACGITSS